MNEEWRSRKCGFVPEEAAWFIPLKLDDCEIPDRRIGAGLSVGSFQWVDLAADWDKGIDDLTQAAGRLPDRLLEDFAIFRDGDAPWCPEMVVIPPGKFMLGKASASAHDP